MKDKYHSTVIEALQKEGWEITDDPLIKIAMERYSVKAVIYDIDKEEIVQWIQ